MSLIDGNWTRDECIVGGCDEPTDGERDTCVEHAEKVRVDPYGSWVPDRHGGAS